MTTWSGSEHYNHGLIVREGLDIDSLAIQPRIVRSSGDITILMTDCVVIIMQTVSAAVNIILPQPNRMQRLTIKDGAGTANANPLTILPTTGTIDGNSSLTLNNAYASVDLIWNGISWNIL